MKKLLILSFVILSLGAFADYEDVPSVIIKDGKFGVLITGDQAKKVFDALKVHEFSTAGHTYKVGVNITCNKYDGEYFCALPYSEKGVALKHTEFDM